MGKLFSKQHYKPSRSNSDPIKTESVCKERHLSLDYTMLENNRENYSNDHRGLIDVINIHKGPINSLATLQPSYCISGGKDNIIVIQVTFYAFAFFITLELMMKVL